MSTTCRKASTTLALVLAGFLISIVASAQTVQPYKPDRKISNPKLYGSHLPQELSGAFWRVDHTFRSTIRIKNVVEIASITVVPVLYMADGTEYALPAVEVEKDGVASVNINDALSKAPPGIVSHLSNFGSAAIRYSFPWDGISATIENLDIPRSLIFDFSFAPKLSNSVVTKSKAQPETPQIQQVDGLWWKYEENVDGVLGLVNVSDERISATVQVSNSEAQVSSISKVNLAPRSTLRISVAESFPSIMSAYREGSIRVSYPASLPRQILVNAGMEDAEKGYSAKMPITYRATTPDKLKTRTVGSVGIMAGVPDPMMMFPANVTFIPYGVIQNTGDRALIVTPSISYMNGQSPVYMQLPKLHLKPREVQHLDMHTLMASAGIQRINGSFSFTLSGELYPGELLTAIGSIDPAGTYVFQVPAKAIQENIGKVLCFWQVGRSFDSMITL